MGYAASAFPLVDYSKILSLFLMSSSDFNSLKYDACELLFFSSLRGACARIKHHGTTAFNR